MTKKECKQVPRTVSKNVCIPVKVFIFVKCSKIENSKTIFCFFTAHIFRLQNLDKNVWCPLVKNVMWRNPLRLTKIVELFLLINFLLPDVQTRYLNPISILFANHIQIVLNICWDIGWFFANTLNIYFQWLHVTFKPFYPNIIWKE